jgi:uncharacterized protein YneF (UPF0154 family)
MSDNTQSLIALIILFVLPFGFGFIMGWYSHRRTTKKFIRDEIDLYYRSILKPMRTKARLKNKDITVRDIVTFKDKLKPKCECERRDDTDWCKHK